MTIPSNWRITDKTT